jgi:hypothetical protein
MKATPANMLTPEFLRWNAMVNGTGPDKPSFLRHPLHAEYVALCSDTTALLTAAVQSSLQIDGTVACMAYAIRMRMFAEIMMRRCDRIASAQINKAKKS